MRIGFDAKRIVRNGTGLGAYGRTLLNDLNRLVADGLTIDTDRRPSAVSDGLELLLYAPDSGLDVLRRQMLTGPSMRFVYPGGHPSALGKAWWRSHAIVGDLRRDGVQLFHGLSGELPLGLRRSGIVGVVTIHDLIFMRHPEYYHRVDAWIYRQKFRATCREATRIIAISERTRQDIMELGGVPSERIDLVYQSCNPRYSQPLGREVVSAVASRLALPRRYVLSVGSVERRKNVMLALKAMALLPDDLHLVVAGRHTPYADELTAWAAKHGLLGRLHLLHSISGLDLQALYQQADVFVYPSRYEGFGIPVIEAVFSRLPVVACTGSCLEEAGGPYNIYVDPDDVEAMAEAIKRLLPGSEDREGRIGRSLHYVERFRGTDVARQVADVYRRALRPSCLEDRPRASTAMSM